MITIIGDTCEELAVLQSIIDTGILNNHVRLGATTLDVTYTLSSGNLILSDEYGHIVGEKTSERSKNNG